MKKTHIVTNMLALFTCIMPLCAQHRLMIETNIPRNGDKFEKFQVTYKDPGRTGTNLVWDFSKLKLVNESYRVEFFEPKNELKDTALITCVEHRTMYPYALIGGRLFSLGFENPGFRMQYDIPELNLSFPFQYGDSLTETFVGHGQYRHTMQSEMEGTVTLVADATGTLILPDEDTLKGVIRVRSERLYTQRTIPMSLSMERTSASFDSIEVDVESSSTEALLDSSAVNNDLTGQERKGSVTKKANNGPHSTNPQAEEDMHQNKNKMGKDNNGIKNKKKREKLIKDNTDSLIFRTEVCRWYAPGYRYPLFETIRNISLPTTKGKAEKDDLATAFYFPPYKHAYLEIDPINQAILDSLLAASQTEAAPTGDSLLFEYNYYPNPVRSTLNIELLLEVPSRVLFRIVDASGNLVLTQEEGTYTEGLHAFTINTGRLRLGENLLHIIVGNQMVGVMLLKY